MFEKIAVQAFEAGDLLNILLRFWGFGGSFSKHFLNYKQRNVYLNFENISKKCIRVSGPLYAKTSFLMVYGQ